MQQPSVGLETHELLPWLGVARSAHKGICQTPNCCVVELATNLLMLDTLYTIQKLAVSSAKSQVTVQPVCIGHGYNPWPDSAVLGNINQLVLKQQGQLSQGKEEEIQTQENIRRQATKSAKWWPKTHRNRCKIAKTQVTEAWFHHNSHMKTREHVIIRTTGQRTPPMYHVRITSNILDNPPYSVPVAMVRYWEAPCRHWL